MTFGRIKESIREEGESPKRKESFSSWEGTGSEAEVVDPVTVIFPRCKMEEMTRKRSNCSSGVKPTVVRAFWRWKRN